MGQRSCSDVEDFLDLFLLCSTISSICYIFTRHFIFKENSAIITNVLRVKIKMNTMTKSYYPEQSSWSRSFFKKNSKPDNQ